VRAQLLRITAVAWVTQLLFFVAGLVMYVSARSVGDGEYRHEFLDPLIEDLKVTLLARNRAGAAHRCATGAAVRGAFKKLLLRRAARYPAR